MKVVHVLKRIDLIDQDIKELRKLEKSLTKGKSFTNAIYMSIEKQINILLGERIKLLELRIENPPANLAEEIEGKTEESPAEKAQNRKVTKKRAAKKKIELKDADEIPMLTQDQIDEKISSIKINKMETEKDPIKDGDNEGPKILDTALEHGTLNKQEIEKTKERKVKFFRENFPSE